MKESDEILLSNKSAAALDRDTERKIADAGATGSIFIIDLKSVPASDWRAGVDLALPAEIARYLDGHGPFTDDEVRMLEAWMEKLLGVTSPYYVSMSPTLQRTGRAWSHIPDAGKYLTGFSLEKE